MAAAISGGPSGPKAVTSLPDYSHKSQELHLLGETAEGVKPGKGKTTLQAGGTGSGRGGGASVGEILPLCGTSCGDQPSDSTAFDYDTLQQYDTSRRYFLVLFWTSVVISICILALIFLSTVDLHGDDMPTPTANALTNVTAAAAKLKSEAAKAKVDAWDTKLTTNFYMVHVICMMIAMVFFSSFSILLYRCLPETPMWVLKWSHGGNYLLILFAMLFGLIEIFYSHSLLQDKPHFQTLHSWSGALLSGIFFVEFGTGLSFVFDPNTNKKAHTLLQEFHRVVGLTLQVVTCATVVTGMTQLSAHIANVCAHTKSQNCPLRFTLSKVYGLLTIIYFALFFVLALHERFYRKARPQWRCIFNNPHTMDESSRTVVSKRSLFSMMRKHRRGRGEDMDPLPYETEDEAKAEAKAMAIQGQEAVASGGESSIMTKPFSSKSPSGPSSPRPPSSPPAAAGMIRTKSANVN